MKVWRSLHFRLVCSYILLALLLLSIAGYVFSNALSLYAISVQKSQASLYAKQAVRLIADAQARGLTPDETLSYLRQSLPDLTIDLATVPPEKTQVMIDKQSKLPEYINKPVVIYTKVPMDDSFVLPMGGITYPTTEFHFALHPSAITILSSLYRQVLVVLILALGLAGIIGWLFSRALSRPLSSLVNATAFVADGNFQQVVAPTGIVELDRLVSQFNRMVLRLRDSFRALSIERDTAQRFASDAAHELKTPVATLRAYQDIVSEHPARFARVAPALDRQIEKMEHIIDGLLKMATLSQGDNSRLQPMDLGLILRQLEPDYRALVEESGRHFNCVLPEAQIPTMLDPYLLQLGLDNLLDNAVKYTPVGGQIGLVLEVHDDETVITVLDTGRGIPSEEIPHIYDRFHRGFDDQMIPGSGLGLAIAQEAIKRLGGRIVVQSQVGLGSQFSIHLPVFPDQSSNQS